MFKKLNHALAVVVTLTMVISLFAGLPPKAQAEVAIYEELPEPPIRTSRAVNPDYPQMEKPVVEAHSNGNGTGYLDVSWNPVEGAEKYQVILFNGTRHSYWDVPATETSWTTKGKGMFPTPDQIEAGQVDFLRNGTGDEFALSPNELYAKAYELNGGLDYRNSVDYYVRVAAVYENGASPISYAETKQFELVSPQQIDSVGFNLSETNAVQLKVDWEPVPYADGYALNIWDGQTFQKIRLGNVTNFDSEQYKIQPAEQVGNWSVDGNGLSLNSQPKEIYQLNGNENAINEYRYYVTSYDRFGRESNDISLQQISLENFLNHENPITNDQYKDIYDNAEEGIYHETLVQPTFDEEGNQAGEQTLLVTREITKEDGDLSIDVNVLKATDEASIEGIHPTSYSSEVEEEKFELRLNQEGQIFIEGEEENIADFSPAISPAITPYKLAEGGRKYLTYYKETRRDRYHLKSYQRPINFVLDKGAGYPRVRDNVKGNHPRIGNIKTLARSVSNSRFYISLASAAMLGSAYILVLTWPTVLGAITGTGSLAANASVIIYEYRSAKSDMAEAYRELSYIK